MPTEVTTARKMTLSPAPPEESAKKPLSAPFAGGSYARAAIPSTGPPTALSSATSSAPTPISITSP